MKSFIIDVWGDFACFTRPEAKVERFSYPIMTPSAARGIFDAIYVKWNEFSWRIDRIEVLRPIGYIGLRRNEVKNKVSVSTIHKAISGGEGPVVIADDTPELAGTDAVGRTQRQTMALKDVKYRLHAHIQPRPGFENTVRSLEAQAERRIASGKCFQQPYLGCREFVAYFEPAISEASPVRETQEIGWMVYDIFDLDVAAKSPEQPYISLFWASLIDGVLEIPDWNSSSLKKPSKRR
ncbi:MAG: type I-C CRISPR-associated protein Cas5c [bacterium]|nr:type I-C CRISPR-associated protein Cas5c [bacterium]